MCLSVSICVQVCAWACGWVQLGARVCRNACVHACVYVCARVRAHAYVCLYVHALGCVCVRECFYVSAFLSWQMLSISSHFLFHFALTSRASRVVCFSHPFTVLFSCPRVNLCLQNLGPLTSWDESRSRVSDRPQGQSSHLRQSGFRWRSSHDLELPPIVSRKHGLGRQTVSSLPPSFRPATDRWSCPSPTICFALTDGSTSGNAWRHLVHFIASSVTKLPLLSNVCSLITTRVTLSTPLPRVSVTTSSQTLPWVVFNEIESCHFADNTENEDCRS